MLGAWNSLVNLLNKFNVVFTHISHTFFSHLSNAHPYPSLKDLKTSQHQKLGFWKGQQPKPCLILKTSKRNLGKELSVSTCVTERVEVENQCPFPTGISFFKHHQETFPRKWYCFRFLLAFSSIISKTGINTGPLGSFFHRHAPGQLPASLRCSPVLNQ